MHSHIAATSIRGRIPPHDHLPGYRVATYGNRSSLRTRTGLDGANHLLDHLLFPPGVPHRFFVVPPAPLLRPEEAQHVRRILVIKNQLNAELYPRQWPIIADAIVVLEPYLAAVVMQSRDCHRVIITDAQTGAAAMVHAMRNLHQPTADRQGILEETAEHLLRHGSRPENLHVLICSGISAEHFSHQRAEDVRYFSARFGSRVITCERERRLDLVKVSRLTLEALGVPPQHISHDGLCTYRDPRLGSYRAEKAGKPNKNGQNLACLVPKRERRW